MGDIAKHNLKHALGAGLAKIFWRLSISKRRIVSQRKNNSFVIVNYHRICPPHFGGIRFSPFFDLRTSPQAFRQHLEFFAEYFCVSTLDEVLSRQPAPKQRLVITFDDGYFDNFHFAKPLLEEFAMPAIVYVVSDILHGGKMLWDNQIFFLIDQVGQRRFAAGLSKLFPDRDFQADDMDSLLKRCFRSFTEDVESHADRLMKINRLSGDLGISIPPFLPQRMYLTPREARALEASRIAIGAHTRSHCLLPYATKDEVRAELQGARSDLSDLLGRSVDHFAFPAGLFNENTIEETRQAGYRSAATVIEAPNAMDTDPFSLRRFHVSSQDVPTLAFELAGYKNLAKRLLGQAT